MPLGTKSAANCLDLIAVPSAPTRSIQHMVQASLRLTTTHGIGTSSSMLQGEVANSWSNKRLIVAHDLISRLSEKLGLPLRALGSLTGAQLAGCQYRHPLFERTSPVVIGGEYITTESGTGLVHTAPGHGQEDYQVGVVACNAAVPQRDSLSSQNCDTNTTALLLWSSHTYMGTCMSLKRYRMAHNSRARRELTAFACESTRMASSETPKTSKCTVYFTLVLSRTRRLLPGFGPSSFAFCV